MAMSITSRVENAIGMGIPYATGIAYGVEL